MECHRPFCNNLDHRFAAIAASADCDDSCGPVGVIFDWNNCGGWFVWGAFDVTGCGDTSEIV